MSNKFLIGIAAAFFAVFAVGIGAVVCITHLTDRTTISDVSSASTLDAAGVPPAFVPFQPKVQMVDEAAVHPAGGITPAPAATVSAAPTGVTVTDSDILRLAEAVKLNSRGTGDVSREVWARETPVAEKLLNGMCDCDQRNWLNHFVQTGKEAMSGSVEYAQSVQVLASLRHSDNDLVSSSGAH